MPNSSTIIWKSPSSLTAISRFSGSWTNQNSLMRGCGGWQVAVHDSRSMKPRVRNANLLITHVLHSCVKLLAVQFAYITFTGSISGSLCGDRNGMQEDDWHHLNSWSSGSSSIWRILVIPYQFDCSAWRSLLLHNPPSGAIYTTSWTCQTRVVRWCTSTLQAPRWCILPRIKVRKAACTSLKASTHHVLRLPPTSAVEERPEERRKTPYSPNINLITTQLSTAANRYVVNRFSYSTSWIGLTTSSCASPRHFRDLSLIFSKIWSTFNQDHHSFVASLAHIFLNY